MASNEDWLNELADRYGASVESSDLDRMQEFEEGIAAGTTSQEQYDRYRSALENQYELRGETNQTGDGPDSTELTRAGYGSEMDEQLYDWDGPDEGSDTVAQSWLRSGSGSAIGNGSTSPQFPDWYKELMERQQGFLEDMAGQNRERGDALYDTLLDRSNQSLEIDRFDPIIRAQADAYSANEERARRNYVSDMAERSGPYANIEGSRRVAAERMGQRTGTFEAQLMGSELAARREEIAQALAGQAGLLTADQTRELQLKLAMLDQAIREQGINLQYRGQDLSHDQFLQELAFRDWDQRQYYSPTNPWLYR